MSAKRKKDRVIKDLSVVPARVIKHKEMGGGAAGPWAEQALSILLRYLWWRDLDEAQYKREEPAWSHPAYLKLVRELYRDLERVMHAKSDTKRSWYDDRQLPLGFPDRAGSEEGSKDDIPFGWGESPLEDIPTPTGRNEEEVPASTKEEEKA